jgi:negative regulator of sigma-B (phosphoserine phosphatase)
MGGLTMSQQSSQTTPSLVEFGVWSKALDSQSETGDAYLVQPTANGLLLAVVDGLGHGSEAAAAAKVAMSCIEGSAGRGLIPLLQLCHSCMKRTRGAVMNLASFNGNDNTMSWLGVGNIEGVLIRADANASPPRENILLRGGVVGLNLPQLFASATTVSRGDTLIFATDGIHNSFADGLALMDSPQKLAERIGGNFCKGTDDALVVTGRYCGL